MVATLAALLVLLPAIAQWPVAAAPRGDDDPPQSPPGTQVAGDGLIVPGERVGSVKLGMSVAQIAAALETQPKREEFKAENLILYEWRRPGIWVSFSADTKLVRVISAFGGNNKYRTEKGLTLMQPLSRAESLYGKDYKRWTFKEEKVILIRYPSMGLQFGVVNDPIQSMLNGRVFQIGIFKPGDLPPVRQP